MSTFLMIAFAVFVVILEKKWAPAALSHLKYSGSCDRLLAEPGETLTWTGVTQNQGRLPVLFVHVLEYLPLQAGLQESDRWQKDHLTRGNLKMYVEEKFWLSPGRIYNSRVRFSLPKRGRYDLGGYRMGAGDLLGIQEKECYGDPCSYVVVMPEKISSVKALEALGGFLGDISVRRFIMEDPILTVGFREYTGREPMKDISWSRTAVTGRLQVRQYDHTAEQTVTVLLNMEGGRAQELEQCFRMARMTCEELEKKHIPFAFGTNGDMVGPVGRISWLAEGLGAQHLNTLLYGLGQAGYTCFYSLETLVEQCLGREKRGQGYIVITPPLEEKKQRCLARLRETGGVPVCLLVGEEEA